MYAKVRKLSAVAMTFAAASLLAASAAQAAPLKVKLTVTHVEALDNTFDRTCFIACVGSSADFYSVARINGVERTSAVVDDDDSIDPNWEFSQDVDSTQGMVNLQLEIWDQDGGLRFNDAAASIEGTGDRRIDATLDLATCNITGDVTGTCGALITSQGGGDLNAKVTFKVEVTQPPSAGNLRISCMHDSIWPNPGETVKITAKLMQLPPPGGPNVVTNPEADSMEIWVDDQTAPKRFAQAVRSLSDTFGPFPSGAFSYGCKATLGGVTLFSGWRRVSDTSAIGDGGHAVPLFQTGPRASRIDIVFSPDQNTYTSSNSPEFKADVAQAINTYLSEDMLLKNQDKLNFYVAPRFGAVVMDPDDDNFTCGSWMSRNWDDDYTFAEAGILLHRNAAARDCHPGGESFSTVFAAPGDRVLVHETGHQPFGLADEYCCDGGYFEAAPYPNLFEEPEDCQTNTFFMGLQPSACHQFDQDISGWWDADWTTSDPDANHLMSDDGALQPLDTRRFEWLLNRCASADCESDGEDTTGISFIGITLSPPSDPRVAPMPKFDVPDGTKTIVAKVRFNGRNQATVESTKVVYGHAATRMGNPPLLRAEVLNAAGTRLDRFAAWHPLWERKYGPNGRDKNVIRAEATGRFTFPFRRETTTLRLTDVQQNRQVIDVDLRPAIQTFCAANPNDADCVRADVAITSVAGVSPLPPYVLVGQPASYTVRTSIINRGPGGPADASVALTAAAGSNKATLTPASSSFTETAIAASQTRSRDQVYTITCSAPTKTPLTFTSRIAPVGANVVDPNTGNNLGQFTFDLKCMVAWTPGTAYAVGDEVVYQGAQYRCRQAHSAQTGWEPPLTYALWERINAGGNWTPQVIYKAGDIVAYNGRSYKAIQGHQAQADWPPPSVPALWAGL